jgi:hypothetical protein
MVYTVKMVSEVSLTKLFSWPGIIQLFLARESLVSDIPAGDGKTAFFTV